MPLEVKLRVRCTCLSEKQRITNNAFVGQILVYVLVGEIANAEELVERCVQLALPQRRAQLVRKASRGEIAVGEHDVVFTDADLATSRAEQPAVPESLRSAEQPAITCFSDRCTEPWPF